MDGYNSYIGCVIFSVSAMAEKYWARDKYLWIDKVLIWLEL